MIGRPSAVGARIKKPNSPLSAAKAPISTKENG